MKGGNTLQLDRTGTGGRRCPKEWTKHRHQCLRACCFGDGCCWTGAHFHTLIHPDGSGPHLVERDAVRRQRVRVVPAEGVVDTAARRAFQRPPALPNPERNLKVLGTPKFEISVVPTQLPKIVSVEGKEAACHCWRPDIIDGGAPFCFVQRLGGYGMLGERPQEAERAPDATVLRSKRPGIDRIDHWPEGDNKWRAT